MTSQQVLDTIQKASDYKNICLLESVLIADKVPFEAWQFDIRVDDKNEQKICCGIQHFTHKIVSLQQTIKNAS
jgi:hypothetical protein